MNLEVLIKKVVQKEALTQVEAEQLMLAMIDGDLDEEKLETALLGLNDKGVSSDELTGFVNAMRTKSLNINAPESVDNCGTGGSGITRINTSTIAAFIVAAAGVKVAKHGNKSASGRCGSFDLLEEAGININLNPDQVQECFDKTNLAFLYARIFHPAMKNLASVRKKIGVPTVFNILGPLLNPAQVKRQVIGVSNPDHAPLIIETLKNLGSEHIMVVHGDYKIDEIAVTGPTQVFEFRRGEPTKKHYSISPRDFGVEPCKMAYIRGGDLQYNRRVLKSILENKDREFRTELVLFNAAAAIYVAGMAKDIFEGYKIAKEALESLGALAKFNEYKELSNSFL